MYCKNCTSNIALMKKSPLPIMPASKPQTTQGETHEHKPKIIKKVEGSKKGIIVNILV